MIFKLALSAQSNSEYLSTRIRKANSGGQRPYFAPLEMRRDTSLVGEIGRQARRIGKADSPPTLSNQCQKSVHLFLNGFSRIIIHN